MKATQRLWRTKDARLVLDGHPDAASLAYAPGDDVLAPDRELAKRAAAVKPTGPAKPDRTAELTAELGRVRKELTAQVKAAETERDGLRAELTELQAEQERRQGEMDELRRQLAEATQDAPEPPPEEPAQAKAAAAPANKARRPAGDK